MEVGCDGGECACGRPWWIALLLLLLLLLYVANSQQPRVVFLDVGCIIRGHKGEVRVDEGLGVCEPMVKKRDTWRPDFSGR